MLSQRRDFRAGVMWDSFGVLEAARAEEFYMGWRRGSWDCGRFRKGIVTVYSQGMSYLVEDIVSGASNGAFQWHYIDKLSNDTVPNHTFITTNHRARFIYKLQSN